MSRLLDAIAEHASARPRALALSDARRKLDWRTLAQYIAERAARLRESGVERLALAGDNGVDWVLWDLAAVAAGAATIPLAPFFNARQIEHVLDQTGAQALAQGAALSPLTPARELAWIDGTAKVTYTSGSTGSPRGVCLAQPAMEAVANSLALATAELQLEAHLAVLPLAVLLENIAGVWAGLMQGLPIHLPAAEARGLSGSSRFDGERLLAVLRETRASSVILVPEMLKSLVVLLETGTPAPPGLRFVAVGGARVGADLIRRARALGLPAYEGYGLSEAASVVALNRPGADRPGTVGRPLPHLELELAERELRLRGTGFLGYLGEAPREPQATLATGDLGTLDGEGFLSLSGRSRNLFITAFGRNVSPEWPESELLAETAIAQAVVLGEGLPAPVALLTPAPGYDEAAVAAAVARAGERLPDYARPGRWHRLPEPLSPENGLLTASGKPRRAQLEERFQTLIDRPMKETA